MGLELLEDTQGSDRDAVSGTVGQRIHEIHHSLVDLQDNLHRNHRFHILNHDIAKKSVSTLESF